RDRNRGEQKDDDEECQDRNKDHREPGELVLAAGGRAYFFGRSVLLDRFDLLGRALASRVHDRGQRKRAAAASLFIQRISQGETYASTGIGGGQDVSFAGLGEQRHYRQVLPLRSLFDLRSDRQNLQIFQGCAYSSLDFFTARAARNNLYIDFLPGA